MYGGIMKTIRIRHSENPELFFGRSGWTNDDAQARNFRDPLEAVTCMIQYDISNAKLVIRAECDVKELAVRV
jgi:hypothetical protein